MLSFHAYYDALANLDDATSDEWQATIAGLIVLRLVNDWLDFPDVRHRTESVSFDSARALVSSLPLTEELRPQLEHIVRLMDIAEEASLAIVEQPLVQYTGTLEAQGRSHLVHDTLAPFLKKAKSAAYTQTIVNFALEIAVTARINGQGDQAEQYYRSVIHHSRMVGDKSAEWKATLGLHKLSLERGEVAGAETTIMDLMKAANRLNDRVFECTALHERAHYAYSVGDWANALTLYEAAITMAKTLPSGEYKDREFLEGDWAGCLGLVGRAQESRHMNVRIAQSAKSHRVRWAAIHNSMYLAYMDDDHELFEQYRKGLEFAPLNPWLAIAYRHYAAHGLRRFGRISEAERESAKAARIAEQSGISDWHLD